MIIINISLWKEIEDDALVYESVAHIIIELNKQTSGHTKR